MPRRPSSRRVTPEKALVLASGRRPSSRRDLPLPALAPMSAPAPRNTVALGANRELRQVAMFFGDPTANNPQYVTFTPQQARELGAALHVYADKADGKAPS